MSVEGDTRQTPHVEGTPAKEIPFSLISPVVISGHPGTGTSTIIDRLGFLYRLPDDKKINIGNLFRSLSLQQSGQDISGFFERPEEEDRSVDDLQKALLENPEHKVFLLESRLGGFIVKRLRENYLSQGRVLPTITTVLITADENVRYQRVFSRNRQKDPTLTYNQAVAETKQREQGDLLQWKKVHPDMENIDPLSPMNADMYAIHIDTTNSSSEEVVRNLHTRLVKLGTVVPEG